MFFQYEDDLVQSAIQKANDFLENSMLSIEESSRINLYNWWTEEPDDGYCVDHRGGKIILEQLDENYNVIANKIIGNFHSYYFYNYDLMGDSLNALINADAISGDTCTAVAAVTHSREWESVSDFAEGILYIDRFYIKPEYRGKKLGYYIFPVLIDLLTKRKNTIVTIIPEPLHDMARDFGKEKEMLRKSFEYKLALKKMKNFFEDFGFKPLGDGQVWAAAVMDEGMFSSSQ